MIIESKLIFEVLSTIAATVVLYISKRIGDKIGVDAQKISEEVLMRAAERAVSYAEERSEKKIKELNEALTGNEKLQEALSFIDEVVPKDIQRKIGGQFEAKAVKEIESALARIEGIGATKLKSYMPKF